VVKNGLLVMIYLIVNYTIIASSGQNVWDVVKGLVIVFFALLIRRGM
jgi:hypothetical protein